MTQNDMEARPYPRLAIVTGADSGIGQATALLFASEGFDVGITVHTDAEGARETRHGIEQRGQRCFTAAFDASSPDAGSVVDTLADQLGGPGVLVNVAGTGASTMALDLTLDEWSEVLATDLTGPFLLAQRAARRMLADGHGGRIINVTSVHEHVPRVGSTAYSVAKAGLGMVTKNLALEWARHGITVNAVAPGEISTEMTGQDESEAFQTHRPGNPTGRPGHVNEVASVIAFLASPGASYATGASYVVDGGLLLMAAHGHDELEAMANRASSSHARGTTGPPDPGPPTNRQKAQPSPATTSGLAWRRVSSGSQLTPAGRRNLARAAAHSVITT